MDNRINPLAGEWTEMIKKKAILQNDMKQTKQKEQKHSHGIFSFLYRKK